MGSLPIPATMFFADFSFDLLDYNVLSTSTVVGTYRGLSNSDEHGDYIGFLVNDQPQISVGDRISTTDGLECYTVKKIEFDRYNGKPDLLKAYI